MSDQPRATLTDQPGGDSSHVFAPNSFLNRGVNPRDIITMDNDPEVAAEQATRTTFWQRLWRRIPLPRVDIVEDASTLLTRPPYWYERVSDWWQAIRRTGRAAWKHYQQERF